MTEWLNWTELNWSLGLCGSQHTVESSKRNGNTRPPDLPPEKSEATVRTGHGKTDWSQVRKGVHQGCILSPCLFNWYAEYIMWNAGLDETQAGIKIAGRNINNLRCADDTTLMAEYKEELKSLLMKEENGGRKIMASGPITLWQIDGETMRIVTLYFWGLQNYCRWWLQPWI